MAQPATVYYAAYRHVHVAILRRY